MLIVNQPLGQSFFIFLYKIKQYILQSFQPIVGET